MGELALDPRDDQISRSAFRRGEESVLSPPGALERLDDLVLRGEDRRASEIELGEPQRVAGRVLLGDPRKLGRLLATDEVIGELQEVDRDARLEERILDLGKNLIELGPREVDRLE